MSNSNFDRIRKAMGSVVRNWIMQLGVQHQRMSDWIGRQFTKAFSKKIRLDGHVQIELNGEIVRDFTHNTTTNTGFAEAAGLFAGVTSGPFDYIGIGTGVTAAAATDTALETEITTGGGERAQDATPTRVTTTVTDDTAQIEYTFTFTSAFAVTEAGLFDAASTGVMAARQVFAEVNVANTDTMKITWKVQFS